MTAIHTIGFELWIYIKNICSQCIFIISIDNDGKLITFQKFHFKRCSVHTVEEVFVIITRIFNLSTNT